MDIRTFVKQSTHAPTYCVMTWTTEDSITVLHGPKYLTKIRPCYVAGDINWHEPDLPIPMSDGGSMTQQSALLLHMSTVSHVLTQEAYANPPATTTQGD